ncbi:MAG: prepilin-type N-terminal cleavage/methylation domain-containing protein [bacterium]|nr:prepilin-type N-terminal cleavage/methylation domain-containing protein [bacterium]
MKKNGFTLIELVIVISIIGLISSIFIPNFSSIQTKAKESSIKTIVHSLHTAIESYFITTGHYPGGDNLNIIELASILIKTGDLISIPKNPFTGFEYSETDSSGKITYSYSEKSQSYTLTALGLNNEKELITIKNF